MVKCKNLRYNNHHYIQFILKGEVHMKNYFKNSKKRIFTVVIAAGLIASLTLKESIAYECNNIFFDYSITDIQKAAPRKLISDDAPPFCC